MPDTTTLNETVRSSIDGSEAVRLATAGANWRATLAAIFTSLGNFTPQVNDGTAASGTVTLSVSAGYAHKLTVGGVFALAFAGWAAAGNVSSIEIQLINGGAFAFTWAQTINWYVGDGTTSTTFSAMGVALQTSGVNFISVWTTDGGTTLYGRAM